MSKIIGILYHLFFVILSLLLIIISAQFNETFDYFLFVAALVGFAGNTAVLVGYIKLRDEEENVK